MAKIAMFAQQEHMILKVVSNNVTKTIQYEVVDANTYELLRDVEIFIGPGETVCDTLAIDSLSCLRVTLNGTPKRGDDSLNYELIYQDSILSTGVFTKEQEQYVYNCQNGQSCEDSRLLFPGTQQILPYNNVWFKIEPRFDTYYDIHTLSDCDTEMWLYEDCDNINPDDQTGAIAYNDNLDSLNAGFNQLLLLRNTSYLIRIRKNCDQEVRVRVIDLKLKKGCMDPRACNFDPFANLEGVECIYDDCSPDLVVNEKTFIESIHLDQIENTNDCMVVEGCLSGYGKRDIVRFTTQIENIGDADYVVGQPIEDSRLFSRNNCHNHWHYLGYAEYMLFDSTRNALPVGVKNGFCALDFSCEDDLSYKYNCNYMGISAGCSDTYDSDLLCQWIDVTDVPDGEYTLVLRVNYEKEADFFDRAESNYDNNWAQVGIRLYRQNEELFLEILEDWGEYRDCFGIVYGDTSYDCKGVCGGLSHYGDINEDGQVSSDDLDIYLDYAKSGFSEIDMMCNDLSGDDRLSLIDYLLLDNCIRFNNFEETDPYHTHCEFPYDITNTNDTVLVIIEALNESQNSFDLRVMSNTDLIGFDLSFTGVSLQSVEILDDGLNIDSTEYILTPNRLIFYSTTTEVLEENYSQNSQFRLYFSDIEEEICIRDLRDVVNGIFEQVIVEHQEQCLQAATTNTQELFSTKLFSVYPNPVSDKIFINASENMRLIGFEIRNLAGQTVKKETLASPKNNAQVEVDFPSGIYLISLNSYNHTEVVKVYIQ